MKPSKSDASDAIDTQLKRIRDLVKRANLPMATMSKEQVIQALRKTRKELWEEKFAPRSR